MKHLFNKKNLFALALLAAVSLPVSAQAATNSKATVAPIYFASDTKDVNHYLRQQSDAANKKIQDQQRAKDAAIKKAADEKKAAETKQAEAQKQETEKQPEQAPIQKTAFHNTALANGANDYAYGTCTWYVKNMLPWVPANLGDASSWAANAAAQGYAVDQTAAVGSVVVFAAGQAGAGAVGHVAVVTAVNDDGSITISEGNFAGLSSHVRQVYAASSYLYIHP